MVGGFHRGIGRAGLVEVSCKRCAGAAFVKNGRVRGHQRYLCKACGCNFTATPERGKPEAMKALAVLLYAMGNASQGMIARLLGVSHVTVYRWLRAAGEAAPEPAGEPSSEVVQIDEMWHFVNGKKTRFGSGGPYHPSVPPDAPKGRDGGKELAQSPNAAQAALEERGQAA